MSIPKVHFTCLALLLSAPSSFGVTAPEPPMVGASPIKARAVFWDGLSDIERKLEDDPDDPKLLEQAGLEALAVDQTDLGLWYLTLALEQAGSDAKTVERISAKIAELPRPEVDAEALLGDYAQTVYKLAKSCESKKLYANAVDLYGRCMGTPVQEDAQKRLAKIYKNAKAVAALLATGLDVPIQGKSKLKPSQIAREDAKHDTWDEAYEIKGKFYTVKTDMGYEMAHAIAGAMEQMNASYRNVFGYKERGGGMRRCVINVFATRAEFDAASSVSQGVKGYFRPGENSVTTYDPRTESPPRSISNLWSTLFHESSHQFTHAVWPNAIPTWLNEGTASYFEGAQLQPNGKVAFNGIPDGRLRNAVILIDQGRPTVEDVITYFKPGSYPGAYYPIGWALVYFCRNYENDASERVFLTPYRELMKAYKSGGKHDVKARFVEYIIDEAKVEGVESFEDFVALWKEWIKDLAKIHFGDASQADVLIARARKQLENGKPEQAIESYRWALRKRSRDPVALAELAAVLADQELGDGAMYNYRRLASLARAVVNPEDEMPSFEGKTAAEALALSLEGIAGVNQTVADGLGEADAAFVEASAKAAQSFADAGLQRNAVHLLTTSQAVMGGDGQLAQLSEELAEGLDLRRWRRLKLSENLEDWSNGDDWSASGDTVHLDTDRLVFATYREQLPASFRYEASFHAEGAGEDSVLGLVFGSNPVGQRLFVVLPEANVVGLIEFKEGVPEMTDRFGADIDPDAEATVMAIEMQPGHAEFYIDGKKVGEIDGGGELIGRVGLIGQQAKAVFEEIRLRY